MEELKSCPFCASAPEFPDGHGTFYDVICSGCGIPSISIQICDLMTLEERLSDPFEDYRHKEEYIGRAKQEAIEAWNRRA